MTEYDYDLRPIWRELLDIYQVYSWICDKYNFKYWVAYGTLIGAVRHHGFIPWDDDFDVIMPREDYERFQAVVQAELPDGYVWKSIYTDSSYGHTFGKVFKQQPDVIARVAEESNLDLVQGLFVDVFPFDGLPRTKFGMFVWHVIRSILRRYASIRTVDWFISRIPYGKAEFVGDANSDWGKIVKRREWASKLVYVPFDSIEVPVPENYDAFLRSEYGDYTQLPPESSRVPAHQSLRKHIIS